VFFSSAPLVVIPSPPPLSPPFLRRAYYASIYIAARTSWVPSKVLEELVALNPSNPPLGPNDTATLLILVRAASFQAGFFFKETAILFPFRVARSPFFRRFRRGSHSSQLDVSLFFFRQPMVCDMKERRPSSLASFPVPLLAAQATH